MSDEEHTVVDVSGDYRYAVRDGEPVESPSWRSCRIMLTSERLVLATSDGQRAIALENVSIPGDPDVVPAAVDAGGAVPVRVGESVLLLDAGSDEDFEAALSRAVLKEAVLLAKPGHDAEWSKARVRLDDDRVVVGLPGGRTTGFDADEIESVERGRATVRDAERPVVTVEHQDDGQAVETAFSGRERHVRAISRLLEGAMEGGGGDTELTETEREVLVALYSGVSPFEMADFVGLEVDEVERIYERLLEIGAVEEVRVRTEVALTSQGRTLASQAMNEE